MGVGEHDRVVVDVDDAALRRRTLGDLMRVVLFRDACADVEELPYSGLTGQVAHYPAEEGTVGARIGPHAFQAAGPGGIRLLGGCPVHGKVRLPAQKVVVDPCDVRDARVNLGPALSVEAGS